MLMHYLSHPFSGDEENNRAVAEAIQRELQERYPKTLYINPIAQFKALTGMEYDKIMGYCLELLYKCGHNDRGLQREQRMHDRARIRARV